MNALYDTKALLKELGAGVLYSTGLGRWLSASDLPFRIVTYHRVVRPFEDPLVVQPGMYVLPETFETHVAYYTSECHVMPLGDLLARIRSSEPIPPRTVVITFDDGWRDVYEEAFPILRAYKAPATIFLATGYIGSESLFWTDRVASAWRGISPDQVSRQLDAFRAATIEAGAKIPSRLSLDSVRANNIAAIDTVVEILKILDPGLRERLIAGIESHPRSAMGQDPAASTLRRHFLSWQEVDEMAANGVTYGSHTHRHLNVTEMPESEAEEDIKTSLALLAERSLPTAPAFCYPGGYLNQKTQAVLERLGIDFVMGIDDADTSLPGPRVLRRINMHEDVTWSRALLAARLWSDRLF